MFTGVRRGCGTMSNYSNVRRWDHKDIGLRLNFMTPARGRSSLFTGVPGVAQVPSPVGQKVVEGCVGSLMRGQPISGMNAQDPMLCPSASALPRERGVMLERGRTQMRLNMMDDFLSDYPDRAAAWLLHNGFEFGHNRARESIY